MLSISNRLFSRSIVKKYRFLVSAAMPPKRKAATKTETLESGVAKSKKAESKPVKNIAVEETVPKRSTRKRTEKPEEQAEPIQEPKPAKRTVRKKKEVAETVDVEPPKQTKATKSKTTKTKAKEAESTTENAKPQNTKSKGKDAAPVNDTVTRWDQINFSCSKKNAKGKKYNLKITSWNVDGIRAWLKKDGMNIFKYDNPDILCLQETKCSNNKLPAEVQDIEGYKDYWCASDKDGYAGVAVYTKIEPIDVIYGIENEDHDSEGRCITLEYENFYLVCVYVPNAGRGLVTLPKRLEWNELFKSFIKGLDEKKPVIICGDMNVAHNEIDLTNPKPNKKNAGFTQEERDGMTEFLEDGYIDSFRKLYPDKKDVYTFWSYMSKARAKNVGWRLDYFILSERFMDNVCDSVVRSEILGSDHCPISLFIAI